MSGVMRGIAVVIVVLGMTWGGVIAYWRTTGAAPSARDMLLYLGVLPTGLLGGGWALRSFVSRARDVHARVAASSDGAEEAGKSSSAEADRAVTAALSQQTLALLGSAVRLPLGLEPGAWLADPLSSARLRPHPRHRDRHGLPVYLAMADDIDAGGPLPQEFDGETTEHVRRALALLEPVVEELLIQAAGAMPLLSQAEGRVVAGWRQQVDQVVVRQLSIDLLVPSDWPMPLREACQAWLQRSAQQFGIDPRRFGVQVLPADGADDAWLHLRRCMQPATRDAEGWHLLLACQSGVGSVALQRREASGLLRTQDNPEGRVPGEAAAGVLFGWPAGEGQPVLRDIVRADLPERVTAAARIRETAELASAGLTASAVDAARIDLVLSDADLRAGPAAEASGVASQVCADLDLSGQYLALCSSTGDVGAVLPLIQLALARHHLDAGGDAALLLTVAPASRRWVAVLDCLSPEPASVADGRAGADAQPESV